jgi:hypothetical protein
VDLIGPEMVAILFKRHACLVALVQPVVDVGVTDRPLIDSMPPQFD